MKILVLGVSLALVLSASAMSIVSEIEVIEDGFESPALQNSCTAITLEVPTHVPISLAETITKAIEQRQAKPFANTAVKRNNNFERM